jgi:hypothetical protein
VVDVGRHGEAGRRAGRQVVGRRAAHGEGVAPDALRLDVADEAVVLPVRRLDDVYPFAGRFAAYEELGECVWGWSELVGLDGGRNGGLQWASTAAAAKRRDVRACMMPSCDLLSLCCCRHTISDQCVNKGEVRREGWAGKLRVCQDQETWVRTALYQPSRPRSRNSHARDYDNRPILEVWK